MRSTLLSILILLSISASAQFAVGHRTITYNDPARNNRAIACEVYYPGVSAGNNVAVAAGEFPVVVLGHGFAMGTNVYTNWSTEFVPDGYIFVMPNTEGSLLPAPSHGAFGLDLKFLVEKLQAENSNAASPFYQHVKPRSGMMGHSMGGGATFLGASGFAGVDCIVGLAPAETNPSAITASANVTAPTLIISGDADGVTPPVDHHIPIYDALGSNCKYLASVAQGSHCYFADYNFNCAFGEMIPGSLSRTEQMAASYALMHPWFDYFLKDDCDAWDDFQTALSPGLHLSSVSSSCVVNAPFISDNGGTLESDQQTNYQWYLNGTEISSADQQSYTYTQSGTYQVGTVILGNCPTFSNEIMVQITGIVEAEIDMQIIGMNVSLRSRDQLKNAVVEWFDLSGRMLDSRSLPHVGSNRTISISKPDYSGLKLLRLRIDHANKVWKVL